MPHNNIIAVSENLSYPEELWPHNPEEAVNTLLDILSESDKEKLRNAKAIDLIRLHHGFGTFIRNQFGLFTRANKGLIAKDEDPDDVSGYIIHLLWERLRSKK